MKSKIALGILLSTGILASCKDPLSEITKLAKDQQLTIEPNPLEIHGRGDKVDFKLSGKLPIKMMKKGTSYTLELYYVPGNIENMADMDPNTIAQGQRVGAYEAKGDEYVTKKEDVAINKEFSFGYQDKFKEGGLFVKGIATKLGTKPKSKEFGPVRLKDKDGKFVKGIATTVLLVKSPVSGVNPTTSESPFASFDHNFTAPKDEFLEAKVNFEKGSFVISPNTANNKTVMETVAELFKETKLPAFEAQGASSHSPEGTEAVNTGLAEKRALALQMQFKAMLEKFKYKKEEIAEYKFNFSKKVMGETVPEFNDLVDASALSAENKADAKATLGGDGDFTEKELKLQKKSYYKELMDGVYPQMRYAKTGIKKPGVAKSIAEMSALTKQIKEGKAKGDALTEAEYLYVASQTSDLDERADILMTAQKTHDTYKVNNNLGATLLDIVLFKKSNDKLNDAIKYLEAGMNKQETGEGAYNLAMAYSIKGDNAKMEEYLKKASNLGSTNAGVAKLINGAKGYLTIKDAQKRNDGKYREAVDFLNNAPQTNPNLFNKGLATLMQGINYDEAIANFNSASQKNPKDAITYYALAVAYARKGSESDAGKALKQAVELDSNLKSKAIKDVEFEKVKNGATFKDAIK